MTGIQPNRLAQGGRLNRAKTLPFWYDDKKYLGHPGDTLASALLANGVMLVGRSFKYHRPRGIFSAGVEEPNALVQLETGPYTEPNRRATEIELYEGLIAHSQNCWPSVNLDFGAVSARLWRLLPAGFYYKTFMRPKKLWRFYEKFIRKAAGLGVSPNAPDPDLYDKRHAHCDVLVVGGGAAGLQAACVAAKSGARVIVVDDKHEFGGDLLGAPDDIGGLASERWIAERIAELTNCAEVTLLARTTLTGYYDYNFLIANQRVIEHLGPNRGDKSPKERLWKIRAKQVVLATGGIECPLVFADNDRPGIMLAGAVRTYINRFGVLAGKNIAVLTNNDSAYQTAIDAKNAGAKVVVVDVRAHENELADGALPSRAREMGIEIYVNYAVVSVDYARGKINGIDIMQLSADGKQVDGAVQKIACDLVAVSGGWTPTVHLFSQSKGELQYCQTRHCLVPGAASVNNPAICAGTCNGAFSLGECLTQGAAAGAAAAQASGFDAKVDGKVHGNAAATIAKTKSAPMRPLWILPCEHPIGCGPKKHFHELHNDSTAADIALAVREGFESVEHLKRYTTTGMGTDQGKTSNLNALRMIADLRGADIADLAATTFRPPFTPLTFGAVVGHERRELFVQKRTTAMHAWHEKRGAVYEDVGDWKRPFYFPQDGENMEATVRRECLAVRNSLGIIDASTLGKIDIRGEDSVKLLNLLYTNAWDKLAIGRCRYGLMLNEHGMVFDDGVTTRLAENHFHMTTTTGGAARVMNWLEEWLQTEWPQMRVYCTSVTEQWAVASISGPKSRDLLGELCDRPLDGESFPFMSMQSFEVAGIPARVFRISFTGELAFEINVPARHGLALWRALVDAGEKYDICPYGTEAMHVLRAEKGFIIAGQDTDGTVTPADLGMDWLVSKKKTDFFGKRSLTRSDTARRGRKQLVGLLTADPDFVLPEGAHVVEKAKFKPPMKMLGHVSSSYFSPNVGRSIALALVADGFKRKGDVLQVATMDGRKHKARVVDPVFFDPDGVRGRD